MGSLGWTPIRVLQAKQEFGCETLSIDKALMEAMTVPGLDQYKSDTEAEDEPMDEEDLLAAQGLQMAVYREQEPGQEGHDSDSDSLARSLGDFMDGELPPDFANMEEDFCDPTVRTEVNVEYESLESTDFMLVVAEPLEEVDEFLVPESDAPNVCRTLQYMNSPAWKTLSDAGMAKTPAVLGVEGCGLMYNRLLGQFVK